MNIHIVKGLLTDCAGLVKKIFTADTFTFEDCMRLRWRNNFYESSSPGSPGADNPTRVPPLSFGCSFSREQMKGIVACATAFHLFCVSTLRVEDMEALFSCREDFSIRVNNVRHVAVMFDALLENRLIEPYWQSVLDKGRFLVSKDGRSYVSASSLSTALSIARIKKTAAANGIRKAIAGLKE